MVRGYPVRSVQTTNADLLNMLMGSQRDLLPEERTVKPFYAPDVCKHTLVGFPVFTMFSDGAPEKFNQDLEEALGSYSKEIPDVDTQKAYDEVGDFFAPILSYNKIVL